MNCWLGLYWQLFIQLERACKYFIAKVIPYLMASLVNKMLPIHVSTTSTDGGSRKQDATNSPISEYLINADAASPHMLNGNYLFW